MALKLERTGVQRDIAEAAYDFVAARCGPSALRDRGEGVFDRATWEQAWTLGWFDLLLPEAVGGLGLGAVEAGTVAEAAGAGLLVGPLFGTMVAGALVRARGVATGVVTVWASLDHGGLHGGRLDGEAALVEHAVEADHLVVRIGGPHGNVVVVERDAAGMTTTPVLAADPTGSLARVTFSSTPVTVVSGGVEGGLAAELTALGRLMNASRTLGVLDRLVALAVEHATTREQFGRPIGAFQALAHLLADLATSATMARSAVYLAQISHDTQAPDASDRIGIAAAFTSRSARTVAEGALQALGGLGFTLEHDLHLYYRHALALRAAWGDESLHERELGRGLIRAISR